MKNLLKGNKGISLVSLCITVAVLLILTNVVIYNTADSLRTTKLNNMQADIENLRDKVSNYYSEYGTIPANTDIEYTNIDEIKKTGVISDATDTGPFYVIDLAAMENVTLNYGKDYEKIKNGEATTQDEINQLKDLYIINSTSHNIFYVQGIKIDNEMFYTDYAPEDADKVAVELHFKDQIKPEVIADKNEVYEDQNGDKAIIPKGFKILSNERIINEGLVIQDEEGNEFVWMPVTSDEQYKRDETYGDINISTTAYTDTGYLPDGIQPTSDDRNNNEQAEKQAVLKAGGFYVSRYEAGKEGTDTLVSKKGVAVYNNISQEEAKAKAKTFINNDDVKSALCSGIQWDVIMEFVTGKDDAFDVTKYDQSRHTGVIANTGENESDKVCNIYDLEGNCCEYVAELNSYEPSNQFVARGGFSTNTNPASARIGYHGNAHPNRSFRFVLYVTNNT